MRFSCRDDPLAIESKQHILTYESLDQWSLRNHSGGRGETGAKFSLLSF